MVANLPNLDKVQTMTWSFAGHFKKKKEKHKGNAEEEMEDRQVATMTIYFSEWQECVKAVSTIHFSQLIGLLTQLTLLGMGPSSLSYSFRAASMTLRPGSNP